MAVFDLYSKRQKRARGEMPDVYVYDNLPGKLRVQIVQIISDAFGEDVFDEVSLCYESCLAKELYDFAVDVLRREFGVFELVHGVKSSKDSLFKFFLGEEDVDRALDVVELCFNLMKDKIDHNYKMFTTVRVDPDDAILELNERFKEHGVGYLFVSGEIIRVDSQLLHAEAMKPTLSLLHEDGFDGANDEFLSAHAHYRHGRYKECLVDALKAFESTMKTICCLRGWKTKPEDSAKNLIAVCMSNRLFPEYFNSQFSSVRSLLESGVPTVRNKNGGHGQGIEPVPVPEYLARYALNLTATSILFMVEANRASK